MSFSNRLIQQHAYRCLLWGSGSGLLNNYHLIKCYELSGKISVCGITSNNPLHSEIGGYPLIEKKSINKEEFDRVIIMSSSESIIKEIRQEAYQHGIDELDIVPCDVMKLIGFDFEKYKMLKSNPPTIFTHCCWGGVTYNKLGLRFDSPFINMFEYQGQFVSFLKNPRVYMESEPVFKEMRNEDGDSYPVAECRDMLLCFNHYRTFDEAKECWERRKKRIHWDNLFVLMWTDEREVLEEFCKLPYEKKRVITPLESDNECVLTISYPDDEKAKRIPFGDIVNGTANGRYIYFDLFDLLLYNKINLVADFK